MLTAATPGQRTAVNLAGIDYAALKRGMVLAAPENSQDPPNGCPFGVCCVSAKIEATLASSLSCRNSETIAEYLHGQKELEPGASAFANFETAGGSAGLPGDRFIVRQFRQW